MKLISPFLTMQNQLRIFHWQTASYAQHEAFGAAYKSFDGLIDSFVEIFTGKYGRSKASTRYTVELDNFNDDYISTIDTYITYLVSLSDELDRSLDSDLLNIRDEMLGELNQLKYLLTLA